MVTGCSEDDVSRIPNNEVQLESYSVHMHHF